MKAYPPLLKRKRRKKAVILIIAALLIFVMLFLYLKLRPVLHDMAMYTITDMVTNTVNDVILEKISDGSLDYNKIVTLEKNESGAITALITNMAAINSIQSDIVQDLMKKLEENETSEIGIPLGNILGGAIFSGRGPEIPVHILSVTNVNTEFVNDFSSAGINQTRHQIHLDISVDMQALVPGDTCIDTVSTTVIAAETIIVGQVPETYADISDCLGG